MTLNMTLIGGPTVLIEADGFRLVTDPTFDPPGVYQLSYVTLTKTSGPALAADAIGQVDAVLLSHDQHSDNFETPAAPSSRTLPACSQPRWERRDSMAMPRD
jgi:L-ascorbate metabolism protein UlaG (beta-lactamase superfamily)